MILLDAGGRISLLAPDTMHSFNETFQNTAPQNFSVPREGAWFELVDGQGTEQFFLLVSSSRLLRLEKAIPSYLARLAEAEDPNSSGLSAARQAVINTLRLIREDYSSLKGTAEKQVPLAGNIRSPEIDIPGEAVFIECEEFYTKTFRFRHD